MKRETLDASLNSISRDKLYADFTLTKDNCASEPIHRPTAIHGHGHLVVFDTKVQPSLVAISDQLGPLLGHETSTLWAQKPAEWLPDLLEDLLDRVGTEDYAPQSLPNTIKLSDKIFQFTHHQHASKLILEFEPEADTEVDDQIICKTAQAFRESKNVDSLYAVATQLIKAAFGYDRVMIYQFDHDKHGMVVGEHKVDELEPFLGLHYPETDIPKMARDLFLVVMSRGITDVNVHTDPLHFNPQLGPNPPYLDLSFSQVRATSPIHIRYLQNMGVAASLSFAIIVQGKLWGLVACHHRSPRQVLFNHKLIGEVIAELLAKRILELETESRSKVEAASREVESFFLERVTMNDNCRVQINEHAACISQLCEADGAALVSLEQCFYRHGIAPSDATLFAIRDWLVNENHDEVFFTSNFAQDVTINIDNETVIGGMLSSCISTTSSSYLLWFRCPKSQLTNWAGDPGNSYSVEPSKTGKDVQISPRQSFAKWQVTVEGQSLPWQDSACEMADRIRQGIYKKELRYTTKLLERNNEEFMQLTFAAAHDLQEPIRTQASYLELLKESFESSEINSNIQSIRKVEAAGTRMKTLVTDLLDYSQLGATDKREKVDISKLLAIIVEEFEVPISETNTQLTISKLPIIMGDFSKLKQLLRNLLSNAIKYVASGKTPEISIYMEQEKSFWTMYVKDNGIGIDPKYHSNIFVMFKRLHGKTEYQGSGIGLAICAKVVESMGAEIGVDSTLGKGSTFWVRFHNSIIA